jgi:xylulokinase
MEIKALYPGWAEQDPEMWWKNLNNAVSRCMTAIGTLKRDVGAVGISYQMHGLVAVDRSYSVLRPSIIWCDSRAVKYGEKAFLGLGEEYCLQNLLNSPGNFTAAKLAWVKENEPDIFRKIFKIMLPGDYIAHKLTGELNTTFTGLSEGIFWDFVSNEISGSLLDFYGFDKDILPQVLPSFSVQGRLSVSAAAGLGLPPGIPVSYRAGDQPNNALSLNVLKPGEVAATAGTSGVIYGVAGTGKPDQFSRVNTFLHVNHTKDVPRLGVLLCINGTGILNSWLRKNTSDSLSYDDMNGKAELIEPGCYGLLIMPFGNGSERMLMNRNPGAGISGLNFNIHTTAHLYRAAQEGIAFSFRYGLEIMKETGITPAVIRAGNANMFRSKVFREVLATVTGSEINLYNTDGSVGAARGAGIGCGYYSSEKEAFNGLRTIEYTGPDKTRSEMYEEIYQEWRKALNDRLSDL